MYKTVFVCVKIINLLFTTTLHVYQFFDRRAFKPGTVLDIVCHDLDTMESKHLVQRDTWWHLVMLNLGLLNIGVPILDMNDGHQVFEATIAPGRRKILFKEALDTTLPVHACTYVATLNGKCDLTYVINTFKDSLVQSNQLTIEELIILAYMTSPSSRVRMFQCIASNDNKVLELLDINTFSTSVFKNNATIIL